MVWAGWLASLPGGLVVQEAQPSGELSHHKGGLAASQTTTYEATWHHITHLPSKAGADFATPTIAFGTGDSYQQFCMHFRPEHLQRQARWPGIAAQNL